MQKLLFSDGVEPSNLDNAVSVISCIQMSFPMGLQPGYDPAHLSSFGDELETDAFLTFTYRLSNNPVNDS